MQYDTSRILCLRSATGHHFRASGRGLTYRQISNIGRFQRPKLKCFSSRRAVVLAPDFNGLGKVENEDAVGAAPTSEWSTILLLIRCALYKRFDGTFWYTRPGCGLRYCRMDVLPYIYVIYVYIYIYVFRGKCFVIILCRCVLYESPHMSVQACTRSV